MNNEVTNENGERVSLRYVFHNFTEAPFTGYWNGKPYTFKSGAKQAYPHLIARHFAKHLTNQVLTDSKKEEYTSPKKPDQVPVFMDIFHKAFIVEEIAVEDNLEIREGDEYSNDEPSMNVKPIPRQPIDQFDANATPQTGPGGKPQVIGKVEDGESSDDDAGYEEPAKTEEVKSKDGEA